MTSTWVPCGTCPSTSSGTGAWWTCTRATASASPGIALGHPVRAAVDEVQLEVVTAQDASELGADVPHAEDRHGGHDGEWLEQHRHLAAAALLPVLAGARSLSARSSCSGAVAAASSRARSTAVSSRLPPPMLPHVRGRHDHLRAGLTRGMAADCDQGDEHAGLAVRAQPLDRCEPVHVSLPIPRGRPARSRLQRVRGGVGLFGHDGRRTLDDGRQTGGLPPPRACWTAQKTASGVAGEARSTAMPGGPNAAAAWRRASRTEMASMSGGSPTALDP